MKEFPDLSGKLRDNFPTNPKNRKVTSRPNQKITLRRKNLPTYPENCEITFRPIRRITLWLENFPTYPENCEMRYWLESFTIQSGELTIRTLAHWKLAGVICWGLRYLEKEYSLGKERIHFAIILGNCQAPVLLRNMVHQSICWRRSVLNSLGIWFGNQLAKVQNTNSIEDAVGWPAYCGNDLLIHSLGMLCISQLYWGKRLNNRLAENAVFQPTYWRWTIINCLTGERKDSPTFLIEKMVHWPICLGMTLCWPIHWGKDSSTLPVEKLRFNNRLFGELGTSTFFTEWKIQVRNLLKQYFEPVFHECVIMYI
jgi:hypothetical protein